MTQNPRGHLEAVATGRPLGDRPRLSLVAASGLGGGLPSPPQGRIIGDKQAQQWPARPNPLHLTPWGHGQSWGQVLA